MPRIDLELAHAKQQSSVNCLNKWDCRVSRMNHIGLLVTIHINYQAVVSFLSLSNVVKW